MEGEWYQIKTHGIVARIFEDEYDLTKIIEQNIAQKSYYKKCQ